jgi:hypothetical protein
LGRELKKRRKIDRLGRRVELKIDQEGLGG